MSLHPGEIVNGKGLGVRAAVRDVAPWWIDGTATQENGVTIELEFPVNGSKISETEASRHLLTTKIA
jgi:hypothetical protein